MTVPPNMRNPNQNQGDLNEYKFRYDFPTRENCDLNDPREMFVWMLVALPGMNGGPQAFPTSYNMMVSEHLFECGAQLACRECGHIPDPVKKYRRPPGNDPHWMTSPGRWVPADTPDPAPNPAKEAWDKLSWQQKAEIRELANTEHDEEP